jgi:predicted nucleotidyltransferase
VDIVRKEIPVSAVYVFGSQAKNTARPDSDIDVAIISPDFGVDRMENNVYLQRKLWDSPYKNIDVLGYSPEYFESEDSPIIHEIKEHGVLVA